MPRATAARNDSCAGCPIGATGEELSLDREVILDPDTVERLVEVGLAGDRSRATYRAVLRRAGPRLTKQAPWEPRPTLEPTTGLVAVGWAASASPRHLPPIHGAPP